jgi:hypothetical protein
MAMSNSSVILAAVALVVIATVVARSVRTAPAAMPNVRLGDVTRVYELVAATRKDGAFGVLLFGKNGAPPAAVDALNIQFSIENGHVGFDWVSNGQLNDPEIARVSAFFAQQGATLSSRSMNGVNYLRTERGDLPKLAQDLLRTVFGVTDHQDMQLIAEGFTWTDQ